MTETVRKGTGRLKSAEGENLTHVELTLLLAPHVGFFGGLSVPPPENNWHSVGATQRI